MFPIQAPIGVNDNGPIVANFQDALLFLLEKQQFEIDPNHLAKLKDERAAQRFSGNTTKAVIRFQEKFELKQSGIVDEQTAKQLNRLLTELGAISEGDLATLLKELVRQHETLQAINQDTRQLAVASNRPHLVSGRISRSDQQAAVAFTVSALHEDGTTPIRLGEDQTDGEGRYAIRYEPPPGGSVNLRVVVLDKQGKALAQSDIVNGAERSTVLNLTLPAILPTAATARIEGRILLEHGLPAQKLNVKLFRVGFGGKRETTPLAETTTDENGLYSLPYDANKADNLEVWTVDADGKDGALSKLLRRPRQRELINLVAPATLQTSLSEFERLQNELTPHIGGNLVLLKDAKESATQPDLTILHDATGWDARLLALAATASKVHASGQTGLPLDALYALTRVGLPSDPLQLARVSQKAVSLALDKAVSSGIVAMDEPTKAAIIKGFGDFKLKHELSLKLPGSKSSLKDLLDLAVSDDTGDPETSKQNRFAQLYFAHEGDRAAFWQKQELKDLGIDIAKVRQQGKLAYLTGNNVALTKTLGGELGEPDPAKEPKLDKLVTMGLYDAAKWDTKITDAMVPPGYASKESYTEDLARRVRISYATEVTWQMITTKEITLAGEDFPESLSKLLENAIALGFKLGETTIDPFVAANQLAIFKDIAANEQTRAVQMLKTVQRVYQITPSNGAMIALFANGLFSAQDVLNYPLEHFLERFGEFFPSEREARLVYSKAEQVRNVTTSIFRLAKELEATAQPFALAATPAERETVRTELIKQIPSLESLFGSLDFCECEHCRSVLSPAAYLVDLLQFLEREPQVWQSFKADWKTKHGAAPYPFKNQQAFLDAGSPSDSERTPYEVLIARRPDLAHLPLTCENTHTALPHIDLVNEILEYYVVHGKLAAETAKDTGDATTDELLAEPQNIEPQAYETLRQARYPLTLPYDHWLESSRQFCNYFEVPLWQLLEHLRADDVLFASTQPYGSADIFYESLGLSAAEGAIFTNQNPLDDWFTLYGYATAADALTAASDAATGQRLDLNSAKALARRLGVSYKELVEIIRSAFVNPEVAKLGILNKVGITIDDIQFYQAHKTLYEQHKDLIGKSYADLSAADKALYDALDETDWNRVHEVGAFVARVMALQQQALQQQLPTSFDAADWLATKLPAIPLAKILVLVDSDAGCDFDKTLLQYAADSAAGSRQVDGEALLRINLFVRLWRKVGWSIEETDRALQAFIPTATPFEAANYGQKPLESALIYLAHLKRLSELLAVGKQGRQKLLTLWTNLPTTGKNSLYAQLFLTRSVLKSDPIFDDALGNYLPEPLAGVPEPPAGAPKPPLIKVHLLTLQGALGVTADEITQILADNGLDITDAKLTLANVSLLYRYGLLAKALKLRINELISLKQLSGVDPFAPIAVVPLTLLKDDAPFTQTLRFVKVATTVKASGLSIVDLDYLLRHRFDAAGKYRPDQAAILTLLKTIADSVRAIRSEHAIPANPGTLNEETLRQKLSLVLPADVADRFWALMQGTAEFVVVISEVADADKLTTADVLGEPTIVRLDHNDTKSEQTIVWRGALLDTQKDALKARLDPQLRAEQQTVLERLLNAVQETIALFTSIFTATNLPSQPLSPSPATGFLSDAELVELLTPAAEIAEGLTAEEKSEKIKENEQLRRRKLMILSNAFLPFLQQRLIRQSVVQLLIADSAAEPSLVESLLIDKALLQGADGRSLLELFAATAEPGISATFYDSEDRSGAAQATPSLVATIDTALKATTDSNGTPLDPANSARFEGYLQVPTSGAYRFTGKLEKQNATITLRFSHLPNPIFSTTAAGDNADVGFGTDEYVELKANLPYRFAVELDKLNGGRAFLQLRGETLAQGDLARLLPYPAQPLDVASDALLLLRKVLQLSQSLGLTERELRYLLTHSGDFGGLTLHDLPTQPTSDAQAKAAQSRFAHFLQLAEYTQLKRDLSVENDDLIAVFEANLSTALDKLAQQVYPLIARLMRRDPAVVQATAEALATSNFKTTQPLARLWQVLQVVEKLGVVVTELVRWTKIVSNATSETVRHTIARDLKETIKARFEPEAWQRVVRPIFDKLRQRQRDALVAYIMHQQGFERIEQLFEYFLIDPGMEPVVQTSRIRAAISAVQLFIQRALLNLELAVAPSAINSKHWQWMKRYRVWEANRKIFLFPENWLEPEFRDDKSHLFTELEGSLLQGDVSNDLVEDAFFNYLKKLDELARLDIVGMYCQENEVNPAANTLHVIGRTFTQPHKYFYRRYVHQIWTPWEPVSAEIQGDHIVPIVWRDRLHLFWVTFMDQVPVPEEEPANNDDGLLATSDQTTIATNRRARFLALSKSNSSNSSNQANSQPPARLAEMSVDQLTAQFANSISTKTVSLQLHWSEYFQGEWSTSQSSDFDTVTVANVPFTFKSNSAFVHASKEYENGEERGVLIHLGGAINKAFRVVSRNSAPEVEKMGDAPAFPYQKLARSANRHRGASALRVNFSQQTVLEDGKTIAEKRNSADILAETGPSAFSILPCSSAVIFEELENGAEIGSLVSPIFYQDNRNTFYVEPTYKETTIEEWQEWVHRTPVPAEEFDLEEYWQALELQSKYAAVAEDVMPTPIEPDDPIWLGSIDERSLLPLSATKDWINPTLIQFDGELIGPVGRAGLAIKSRREIGDSPSLPVTIGSALAPDNAVVVSEQDLFALNGLQLGAGSLNIVGANGLHSALRRK